MPIIKLLLALDFKSGNLNLYALIGLVEVIKRYLLSCKAKFHKENSKFSETLLFSIWNAALQDNKYVLITSTKPINSYKFELDDLRSRVNSSMIIGINLPNDNLISVILAKNFSDKQIKIEKKHIDYIIKRIDRSYEKISQFISILDKYSLKKNNPFNLKLIKEVLKMI